MYPAVGVLFSALVASTCARGRLVGSVRLIWFVGRWVILPSRCVPFTPCVLTFRRRRAEAIRVPAGAVSLGDGGWSAGSRSRVISASAYRYL